MQGAFRSPPAPLRVRLPKQINVPVGRQVPIRAVVGASIPPGARGMHLRAHQRAFRSPFENLRATEAGRKPIGRQPHQPCCSQRAIPPGITKRLPAGIPFPAGRRLYFQSLSPSPHPPLRRIQCISGTQGRKPRWAGSPASAWPSSRPCPPSRSRLSGTARQWGWSCTS